MQTHFFFLLIYIGESVAQISIPFSRRHVGDEWPILQNISDLYFMENKTILAGAIQAVEFEGINHCSRENPKLEMVGFGFVNEVIILKSIVRCERYKIVFKLKTNRNDLMYPKPVKLTSVRIKKS